MRNTLSKLQAFDRKNKEWRVIIETPRNSHNKYKYDEKLGLFLFGAVLPEGMSFPYDFGFLPSTLGEDGDPLDVLLLMDEPTFCGCLVPSRLIGVIEARQTERDGTQERNDRLVALPVKCRRDSDCKTLKDLSDRHVEEIEQFFVSYNRVNGKKFEVLNVHGPKRAEELARAGMKTGRKRRS